MDVKEAIKQLGELRDGTQRAIDGHGMVYANGERIVLAKYSQALGTAINALTGHAPGPVPTCLLPWPTRHAQNDCGTMTGVCLCATWGGC